MDIQHAKEEYEIQIYKFSIKQMQEDTESIIKKRTYDFVTSLFRTLSKQNLINENDERLVKVRQQIINNIYIKVKTNINSVHKKFTEYFEIPDNVLLLENMPNEKYCKDNYNFTTRNNKVNKLEIELLQMKLFRKKLEEELEYHKEIDNFLLEEQGAIGIIKSILSEGVVLNECRNEEIMINKLKQINETILEK